MTYAVENRWVGNDTPLRIEFEAVRQPGQVQWRPAAGPTR